MTSNQNRGLMRAAGLIVLLASQSHTNSLAQTSPKSAATIAQAAKKGNEKPFDKLELFCFFAAGPVGTYAKYILQERGADFTPDADFISSFSSEVQGALLCRCYWEDGAFGEQGLSFEMPQLLDMGANSLPRRKDIFWCLRLALQTCGS